MRRNMSGGKYKRKFNRAHKRTKAVNRPAGMSRGGFRF